MGDCDGRMYPLSKFSFIHLLSSICSSGVKLYVLKDFGSNPSFSSILWSQERGSGNRSALASLNRSKYLWYASGIISSIGRSSFFSSCFRWNSIALEVFALIQVSFGGSNSSRYATKSSLSGVGFLVWFRCSSLSGSSVTVGLVFKALHGRVLARKSGAGFPWFFLRSRTSPGYEFRHSKFPVFQLIFGFCSFNHGKPSITFCFPNPDINSRVQVVLP